MTTLAISTFTGLDLRPTAADRKGALEIADNVVIGRGGAIERRPGLVPVATCAAGSVGLYVALGRLRTAINSTPPAGNSMVGYDRIVCSGTPERIAGCVVDSGGFPYLLLRRVDGGTEYHYVRDPTLHPETLQRPGFTPSLALAAAEGRVWALDLAGGSLRYSRISKWDEWTENGSTVPNLVDVARYAQGGRSMTALAPYRGRIVVFAQETVQAWRTGPDPENIQLEQSLNGIGTIYPQSVAPVVGDVVYLGHGMFRSLSNSEQTLEMQDDPFGVTIARETRTWAPTDEIIGFHAPSLGRYLAFRGTTVWVKDLIGDGGWTTWTLPVSVTDAVEHLGQVYVRAGTTVYRLDEAADTDAGTPIRVRVRTVPMRSISPNVVKQLSTVCSQATSIRLMIDGRTGYALPMPGRAPEPAAMPATGMGRSLAIDIDDMVAQAGWRLDGFALEYKGVR